MHYACFKIRNRYAVFNSKFESLPPISIHQIESKLKFRTSKTFSDKGDTSMNYVIRCTENKNLFFNHRLGWTDLISAQVFSEEYKNQLNFPIQGDWIGIKPKENHNA